MENRLKVLSRSAHASAKFRGHKMSKLKLVQGSYFDIYVATCEHCQLSMHVDSNPQFNDIDIGGQAIALHCNGDQS